jgi:phage gp29-like protein
MLQNMAIDVDVKRKPRSKRGPGGPANIEGEITALGGEMLLSGIDARRGGVYFTPVDTILARKGWTTYRDMRHDEQIKACLQFKKTLVGGREFNIEPSDDSEQAKEIAKFVMENLQRFNFKSALRQAMTAFDFGFSVGEILWELSEYNGQRAVMLKDIKHRDPQSMEIKMDDHGNILGFRQTQIGQVIELPRDKIWHWAHNAEFGNAYGQSDLRAAYRPWWAKKFIINFWNVFLERMGSPMTMVKYPQGASDQLKTTLKNILQNLSAKTEIMVPDGVTVDLVEAKRAGQGTHKDAINYCDIAIARALLMVGLIGLSLESSGRGSDSESRLHLRLLFKTADESSQDLAQSFMLQVIRPMVDMNFVHEHLYPKFVWQDYGAFEGTEISDSIRTLHLAGVLDLDQNDINYVRSVMGLPLRDAEEKPDKIMRPALIPPVGGGVPAPEQGNDRAAKGSAEKTTDAQGDSKQE